MEPIGEWDGEDERTWSPDWIDEDKEPFDDEWDGENKETWGPA